LSDKNKFNEIKEEFLNFIKNKRLIIHNAEFDIAHLNNELGLIGKKNLDNEIIDTLILARNKFPGSSVSLDALCKRYGVDNSRRKNHTALMDCDLLAKVYINLIDQREPTLNFQAQNENTINTSSGNISYYKKIIKPNAKELQDHKEYLKSKLKKNYF
jgi:DNA polymerase-3 subunit epsilon